MRIITDKDYILLQEKKEEVKRAKERKKKQEKQKKCNHKNSRNIRPNAISYTSNWYKCFDCGLESKYDLTD